MTGTPDLDALEALREAATPGPWYVERDWGARDGDSEWYIESHAPQYDDPPLVAEMIQGTEDARYLVALHNADLIAALREAETTLANIRNLAALWTASEGVDDPHTRVTNRAYAGILYERLNGKGEPTT